MDRQYFGGFPGYGGYPGYGGMGYGGYPMMGGFGYPGVGPFHSGFGFHHGCGCHPMPHYCC